MPDYSSLDFSSDQLLNSSLGICKIPLIRFKTIFKKSKMPGWDEIVFSKKTRGCPICQRNANEVVMF